MKKKMGRNKIDLAKARKYLRALVPQAGKILKGYFLRRDYYLRKKEGVDFTTQADEEVDQFLRENLQQQYPQTNFLTEETAPPNYFSLKETENLWVIDPLDGTINFSRQNSHFAITIALVSKGRTRLGMTFLPISGDWYWAQEDQKEAFLNQKPLMVSKTDDLKETVLACDWAWGLEKRLKVVKWLGQISSQVRQVKSMGCAAADLALLAEGKIDVYLHSGFKPWDVAASALLVEKAGGRITTPPGKAWDVFQPEILASNSLLHDRLLSLID
jgi:myo-inositol-1(or 4)-monophosphatase